MTMPLSRRTQVQVLDGLVLISEQRCAWVFDWSSGELLHHFHHGGLEASCGLAHGPRHVVVVGSGDGVASGWSARSGAVLWQNTGVVDSTDIVAVGPWVGLSEIGKYKMRGRLLEPSTGRVVLRDIGEHPFPDAERFFGDPRYPGWYAAQAEQAVALHRTGDQAVIARFGVPDEDTSRTETFEFAGKAYAARTFTFDFTGAREPVMAFGADEALFALGPSVLCVDHAGQRRWSLQLEEGHYLLQAEWLDGRWLARLAQEGVAELGPEGVHALTSRQDVLAIVGDEILTRDLTVHALGEAPSSSEPLRRLEMPKLAPARVFVSEYRLERLDAEVASRGQEIERELLRAALDPGTEASGPVSLEPWVYGPSTVREGLARMRTLTGQPTEVNVARATLEDVQRRCGVVLPDDVLAILSADAALLRERWGLALESCESAAKDAFSDAPCPWPEGLIPLGLSTHRREYEEGEGIRHQFVTEVKTSALCLLRRDPALWVVYSRVMSERGAYKPKVHVDFVLEGPFSSSEIVGRPLAERLEQIHRAEKLAFRIREQG